MNLGKVATGIFLTAFSVPLQVAASTVNPAAGYWAGKATRLAGKTMIVSGSVERD